MYRLHNQTWVWHVPGQHFVKNKKIKKKVDSKQSKNNNETKRQARRRDVSVIQTALSWKWVKSPALSHFWAQLSGRTEGWGKKKRKTRPVGQIKTWISFPSPKLSTSESCTLDNWNRNSDTQTQHHNKNSQCIQYTRSIIYNKYNKSSVILYDTIIHILVLS